MNGEIPEKVTGAFLKAQYYTEPSATPIGKPRAEKSASSL